MHIIKLLIVLSFLFSAATQAANHAANPKVDITTNFGHIVLELYPDKAPKTVQNFLSYVKDG
ncbi:MAG: peptidylprolyl isomerase, partial [Nitrosospira sp.]|nr:peptidylprolyl isomerase [Nitrosospira sp.]